MNLLSSGSSHGSIMQCTWTMDNIFMPESSPWIIPKQLSLSNRISIPLWVLDPDISAFLYLKALCLLGLDNAEMYNYRLILPSCDDNLIFLTLKAVILKNVTRGCDGAYHSGWFLPDINGFRGLFKLIMRVKQSSEDGWSYIRVIYRKGRNYKKTTVIYSKCFIFTW